MKKVDNKISRDFRRLGIPEFYHGEQYLYTALELVAEDPTNLCCITKQIYPDVAKRHNTTPICVERNLRTLISKVWVHKEYLEGILGRELKKKPSNRQFIDLMAVYLYDEAEE